MNFSFSVIIPCRNEEKYIERCIDSVINNNYDSSLIEIIVCDGLSEDCTRKILEEYKQKFSSLRILDNENRTTQFALNLGIKKSRNQIVMILGAHSELANNFFSVCNKILNEKPEVMCVGGVLENIDEDENSKIISLAMSSPFGVGGAHFRTGMKEGEVDTVAFGSYRREVFDKVGLFDETLPRNQDDEFNFRLMKNKMLMWLTSETSVRYYVRSSFKKLFGQYEQYGYWKVFVNRKHRTVTTLRQLIPFFFTAFLIVGLVVCVVEPKLFSIYFSIIILYLLCASVFALRQTNNIFHVFRVIYAFLILHISYGWGYMRGIVDFFILGKNPSAKQHQLTR